jgi:hypothetical protein
MATAVLFIGWNRPHNIQDPDKAFHWLVSEGVPFLKKQEGKFFERADFVALTAHGGDLNGCIVLFGERAKLDEFRRTDEFEGFVMNLSRHFDRPGVIPGLNWDGIQAMMKRRNIRP